jgi:hypothetical protein
MYKSFLQVLPDADAWGDDGECHGVTHQPSDVFPELAHVTGIAVAFGFRMAMTVGRH